MMRTVLIASCLCFVAAVPAQAKDGVKTGTDGITFESGPLELTLGGRVHLDAAFFDDPASSDNRETDLAFRRARIELSGRLGKAVRFRVDREFAGSSTGWRNVWLSVEPVEDWVVKGGNFTVPFSGEDLQSSNSLPFMERSLASALTPGFGLGGSVSTHGRRWAASVGYFTDPLDNEENRSSERGNGFTGRVSFTPLDRARKRVHLALGAERRSFDSDERIRFSADPGSNLAADLMSSGTIGGLDHLTSWTAEAGAALGSVLVQGQHISTRIDRDGGSDLGFNGQTLQASWLVTGERYDYVQSQGYFDGPELRRKKHAIELAARVSRLDLDDSSLDRGNGRSLTGGVNFYLNRNVRFMGNYSFSRVRFDNGGTVHDRVGAVRAQVAF